MMKFAGVATAALFLGSSYNYTVSADPSRPKIRGGQANGKNNEWVAHPTDSHRRRRRLQLGSTTDEDCVLVLKAIDYEDHGNDEDVWACEFQHDFAEEQLNGNDFIDISIPKEVIDELHPVSGASILKADDAFVEESLHTKEMAIHIPEDGEIQVEQLDETHERHYKQRRLKEQRALRSLADSSPGELSVLVVRVVDSNGSASSTKAQLVDDIFTDEFSLKSGYAMCSKDQLIIQPASGNNQISNGIVTVNLDIPASRGQNALQNSALQAASSKLGSLSQWDLVMFCQPPNGRWLAYAYINSWASFYNGRWCNRFSAQMHEVGHNLGLGHSNEPGQSYGDQSSMMGYSYDIDDGPKMCFNAAKNFQLGWYERQKQSFHPSEHQNEIHRFVLNGVTEYKTSGDTGGKLITLRMVRQAGRDYYVGFNDAKGVNSGTIEGRNQVLIFEKLSGGPTSYGESNRVAALSAGNSYRIANFSGENFDVTIKLNSITNGGRDANIEIEVGLGDGPSTKNPTKSPTPVPVTKSPVRPTRNPTRSPTPEPTPPPTPSLTHLPTSSPTPNPTPPPPPEKPPPTDAPTTDVLDDYYYDLAPTAAPTVTCPPDSTEIVLKRPKGNNREKYCWWIQLGKTLAIRQNRCERKWNNKRVKERCPQACGKLAGVGECAFLWTENAANSVE